MLDDSGLQAGRVDQRGRTHLICLNNACFYASHATLRRCFHRTTIANQAREDVAQGGGTNGQNTKA